MLGPLDDLRQRFESFGEIADSFTLCVPFYELSEEKSTYYSRRIVKTFY